MTPFDGNAPQAAPQTGADATVAAEPKPVYRWYHKMTAVLFITFCLEIGLFLIVFPWTEYWEVNYLVGLIPAAQQWWDNLYVRGAVSGLGVVNIYISLAEVFRLRRFARR
jgi:hypothetical protein